MFITTITIMLDLNQKQLFQENIISVCFQSIDNYFIIKNSGMLSDYFSNDFLRATWEHIEKNSLSNGITPEIISSSLYSDTENKEKSKQYFLSIKDRNIDMADVIFAINKLKEDFTLSKLSQLVSSTMTEINEEKTSNEIIGSLMDKIFSLNSTDSEIIEYDSKTAAAATRKDLNNRINGIIDDGVPSGIQSLDEQIKCFYYSLFSIIIGRPGHGKTTLMINCFLNNAKAGYKPVFFSLEMPVIHLIIKILSIMTQVKTNKIMDPQYLTADEKNRIKNALIALEQLEFYIIDAVSMNVTECEMYLNKYIKKGCKIAYLDYIQLLKLPNNKTPNDAAEFREISKLTREILRRINRIGNMSLVVGAQAGRTVESRNIEERIPTQRDLEWTSSLEQDASLIIGIMNREKYEGEDCEYKNQLFVGFPKHRYENAKKINLAFLSEIQFITDLAQNQEFIDFIDKCEKEINEEKNKKAEQENNSSEPENQ